MSLSPSSIRQHACLIFLFIPISSAIASETSELDFSGVYIGAGAQMTSDIDSNLTEITGVTEQTSEANGYQFFIGYRFGRVAGLELAHTQYSDVGFNYTKRTQFGIYTRSSQRHYTTKLNSTVIRLNLGYRFDSGLRPFATVGMGTIQAHSSNESLFLDNDTPTLQGSIGLEYEPKVFKGLAFRAGWQIETNYFGNTLDLTTNRKHASVDNNNDISGSFKGVSAPYIGLQFRF